MSIHGGVSGAEDGSWEKSSSQKFVQEKRFQCSCAASRIIKNYDLSRLDQNVQLHSSKVENACLGVFAGKACVW